jgi:hypothetical protein
MSSQSVGLVYFIAGAFAFSFFWRRREAIAHTVRGVLIACASAALTFILLWKGGLSPLGAYISALVVGVLVRRIQPPRSRYVKARVKRQVIAKFERETGKSFERRLHELDHVHPHSRGGGSDEDNLQVLPRKKNRSKGAKVS